MKRGDAFGKLLILSFEDYEEHIINRILSCLNEETEVLRHRISITRVAKKLIRVIYALVRQDVDFNVQKLR